MIRRTTFACLIGVERMGRAEILRTIKQAEQEASEAVEKAKEEAAQAISNARVEASESEAEGKRSADGDSIGIVQAARNEAGVEAEAVAVEGAKRIAAIHDQGDKSRHDAVQSVLRRFLA